MRVPAIVILALILCAPARAATHIADPVKFVASVYANENAATDKAPYDPPDDIYTPRLAALFAQEKREANGTPGNMDFDFWSNSQDYLLRDVKVSSLPVYSIPNRKIVVAKFMHNGISEELHFYFEKTPSGWLLDDARSLNGGTWTLSLILKYGWDGQP